MKRLALVLLAAGCAPHTGGTGATSPTAPKSSRVDPFDIPPDRLEALDRLDTNLKSAARHQQPGEVRRLLRGGDPVASALDSAVDAVLRARHLGLYPACPVGSGLIAMLQVDSSGYAVYVAPDETGTWTVSLAGPQAPSVLVSEVATVTLDHQHDTLSGDATLTLHPAGMRWVPIRFDLAEASQPGYAIDSVEEDGAPAPYRLLPGLRILVVKVDETKSETLTRIVFHGPPRSPSRLRPDELYLANDESWLPVVVPVDADLELTIDYPRDFDVLLEDLPAAAPQPSGRLRRTMRKHVSEVPGVFGRPGYHFKDVALHDVSVTIAVEPDHSALADRIAAMVRDSLDSLEAILGPPAAHHLRVVEVDDSPVNDFAGHAGESFIALSSDSLQDAMRNGVVWHLVVHELAHGWFGVGVPNASSGDWGGNWDEALAEYAVIWTLPARDARILRAFWSDQYGRPQGDEHEDPLRTANLGTAADETVLYAKGPLVFAGLEDRIGRSALQKAFRAFAETRRGTPSTWQDLVEAIRGSAGDDAASWLASHVALRGAPAFLIDHVALQGDRVVAGLERSDASYDELSEVLTVALVDSAGRMLTHVQVQSQESHADVSLPYSDHATRVVLDPDYMLPWKKPEGNSWPVPK